MDIHTDTLTDPPILSLKPPRRPFEIAQPAQLVSFLHPGYPDGYNILLTLPALDSGGIHYGTAHTACAILANCRWDGFLSSNKDGPRLTVGEDDILPHGQYYFCIDGDEQYPVVPTFNHFRCPNLLPSSYFSAPIASSSADDVTRRDTTCRITASAHPNESAHIIPAAQIDWWQRNGMFVYTVNPSQGLDTRCTDNTILLRRDFHKMWDDNKFAIVPKEGKWVVHVLWNSSSVETRDQYHNLELQQLASVSRHFFLCRFALAVFSNCLFLSQAVTRKLVFVDTEGSTETKDMTAVEYQREFYTKPARGDSRSGSPKKRLRPAPGDAVEDGCVAEELDDGDDYSDEEDQERGRRRQRKRLTADGSASLFEDLDEGVAGAADIGESRSPPRKQRRVASGIDHPQTPPRSISPSGL